MVNGKNLLEKDDHILYWLYLQKNDPFLRKTLNWRTDGQADRQTDKQTDGQRWFYRMGIASSVVWESNKLKYNYIFSHFVCVLQNKYLSIVTSFKYDYQFSESGGGWSVDLTKPIKNMPDLAIKAVKIKCNTKKSTKEQIRRYGKKIIHALNGIFVSEDFILSKIMDCTTPTAFKFKIKSCFN